VLKVEVGGYFVGKARDLDEAEDLVMAHIQWMDSAGKFDAVLAAGGSVTVPFFVKQRGKIVFEGDARLDNTSIPSRAQSGVANP
jgi:hypothetical protein